MSALRRLKISTLIELLLWSIGTVWLVFAFTWRVKAGAAQKASFTLTVPRPGPAHQSASLTDKHVMGRIDVPAIDLSVPILDNYDPTSLRSGVGHIQGTAMPGGLGNLGLAGHRDTYFRPLRHISQGMEIHVTNNTGEYRYIVDSTQIVTPGQVDVLNIADHPSMTLITCYPFDFVGAAPKRFVVQAHLVSLETTFAK
jgi:sortase A